MATEDVHSDRQQTLGHSKSYGVINNARVYIYIYIVETKKKNQSILWIYSIA